MRAEATGIGNVLLKACAKLSVSFGTCKDVYPVKSRQPAPGVLCWRTAPRAGVAVAAAADPGAALSLVKSTCPRCPGSESVQGFLPKPCPGGLTSRSGVHLLLPKITPLFQGHRWKPQLREALSSQRRLGSKHHYYHCSSENDLLSICISVDSMGMIHIGQK